MVQVVLVLAMTLVQALLYYGYCTVPVPVRGRRNVQICKQRLSDNGHEVAHRGGNRRS
jgi:hypothetical protein